MKKQIEQELIIRYFDRRIDNLKLLVLGGIFWILAAINMLEVEPSLFHVICDTLLFFIGLYFVMKAMFFEDK